MKVLSVNASTKKGVIKVPVDHIELDSNGIMGDAHAGNWHRQVSLLGKESFEKFKKEAGRNIEFGEFAENITTEGLLLHECKPFDIIKIGEVILEITQIGKSCHGDGCAIYKEVGNCVMPKEGVFARVVKGGVVKAGDTLEYQQKIIKTFILTLSDRAASGEYSDRSGPVIAEMIDDFFNSKGWQTETVNLIIPDEADKLKEIIDKETNNYDIIFTTGGTGVSRRDITTDTLKGLLDKEIPGIMDLIRLKYGEKNPNALISRSIAGVRYKTVIFALPGSVNAVKEYMTEISQVIIHLLFMIQGIDNHE